MGGITDSFIPYGANFAATSDCLLLNINSDFTDICSVLNSFNSDFVFSIFLMVLSA